MSHFDERAIVITQIFRPKRKPKGKLHFCHTPFAPSESHCWNICVACHLGQFRHGELVALRRPLECRPKESTWSTRISLAPPSRAFFIAWKEQNRERSTWDSCEFCWFKTAEQVQACLILVSFRSVTSCCWNIGRAIIVDTKVWYETVIDVSQVFFNNVARLYLFLLLILPCCNT